MYTTIKGVATRVTGTKIQGLTVRQYILYLIPTAAEHALDTPFNIRQPFTGMDLHSIPF